MTAAPPSGAGGFEEHLDRWGTHSAKWDLLAARLGPEAVSMSVADMELRTAPCVIDAVTAAARHGTYGYTEVFDDFRRAAVLWQRERHGWAPEPDCVRFFPRVVQCVSALLNVVLPDRRAARPVVVTLDPAYGPLLEVAERSGAEIRRVPLLLDDFPASPARIDIPALERALDGADLFLLCNPHNPTGRIWTAEELGAVADAVLPTGVLVLSDDIHADFQRPGRTRYAPIASTRPALWESGRLIQCASPGKTFTIAGLEATAVLAPRGPRGRARGRQAPDGPAQPLLLRDSRGHRRMDPRRPVGRSPSRLHRCQSRRGREGSSGPSCPAPASRTPTAPTSSGSMRAPTCATRPTSTARCGPAASRSPRRGLRGALRGLVPH